MITKENYQTAQKLGYNFKRIPYGCRFKISNFDCKIEATGKGFYPTVKNKGYTLTQPYTRFKTFNEALLYCFHFEEVAVV